MPCAVSQGASIGRKLFYISEFETAAILPAVVLPDPLFVPPPRHSSSISVEQWQLVVVGGGIKTKDWWIP